MTKYPFTSHVSTVGLLDNNRQLQFLISQNKLYFTFNMCSCIGAVDCRYMIIETMSNSKMTVKYMKFVVYLFFMWQQNRVFHAEQNFKKHQILLDKFWEIAKNS